jgi:hypothetical protein
VAPGGVAEEGDRAGRGDAEAAEKGRERGHRAADVMWRLRPAAGSVAGCSGPAVLRGRDDVPLRAQRLGHRAGVAAVPLGTPETTVDQDDEAPWC